MAYSEIDRVHLIGIPSAIAATVEGVEVDAHDFDRVGSSIVYIGQMDDQLAVVEKHELAISLAGRVELDAFFYLMPLKKASVLRISKFYSKLTSKDWPKMIRYVNTQ